MSDVKREAWPSTTPGHFVVNESRQTNVPHIYAIGDVAGLPWLAHKASKEGLVAAEHAAGNASSVY